MKKKFEEPIVEIAKFSVEDIITASGDINPPETTYTPDPDEGGSVPF